VIVLFEHNTYKFRIGELCRYTTGLGYTNRCYWYNCRQSENSLIQAGHRDWSI